VVGTLKITLILSGMDCSACAIPIERGLKAVNGVVDAKVNYLLGKAVVEFDPKKVKKEDLVEVIEKTGYKVVP
jgi:Cu+-exporting ATPase